MNIAFILEHLGYNNGIDFEYRKSTGITWFSDNLPQPSDQDLQDAWNQYLIDYKPILLEENRVAGLKHVDTITGETRSRFISAGIGQDFVYQEKARQAQEFKDSGYVNPENFLFIEKEAATLNKTPKEVADIILANRNTWIAKSSDIEQFRLAAKQDIKNAVKREEIVDRLDLLQTDLDAF